MCHVICEDSLKNMGMRNKIHMINQEMQNAMQKNKRKKQSNLSAVICLHFLWLEEAKTSSNGMLFVRIP